MRVTLDTNVLVSGHSPGSGDGRRLLLKILRDGHCLVLSQTILYELEEVLRYPRIRQFYGLTDAQICVYVETDAFAAAPDGNRLLVTLRPDLTEMKITHLAFLLNFFDEVHRRLRAGGEFVWQVIHFRSSPF